VAASSSPWPRGLWPCRRMSWLHGWRMVCSTTKSFGHCSPIRAYCKWRWCWYLKLVGLVRLV
jgi:hypothetical protein